MLARLPVYLALGLVAVLAFVLHPIAGVDGRVECDA